MASTVRSGDSTAAGAAPDAAGREKADAAKLLDLVFGAEVLAAIHEGFLKDGDYRGVLPLLGAAAAANTHVRAGRVLNILGRSCCTCSQKNKCWPGSVE